MRILVVDHNAIHSPGQSIYRQLAATGDLTIRIIVPSVWYDNYRTVRGEALHVSERCDVVPLPVVFPTRTHRMIYRGLGRQVKEFSPDILYINAEPENFQTMQCVLVLRSQPVVSLVFSSWRNIDLAVHGYPYKLPALHAGIERRVLARAQCGIAFNNAAREIFRTNGFDRMTLIPPEVDGSLFKPMHRILKAGPGSFTVGYAGRLHDEKGIDLLLDALAGIPDDVRLLVVGSGPAEKGLKLAALRMGLTGRIEWRKPVDRRDMPEQLASMDLLVLPSRSTPTWQEQFGRILIEAMACGVPVIGSSSGEIPEVIGDAGIVFPENDAASLRKSILLLRDDHQLRETLVHKGRERVNSHYELSRIVPRYAAFFKAIRGAK